jgi:hypothetical protein
MDQRDKQIIAEAIDDCTNKDVIIRTLNEQVDWQIASVLDDISSIECIYGCLDKVDRGSMQFKVSVQGRGPKPALFRLILNRHRAASGCVAC